MTKFKLGQVQF